MFPCLILRRRFGEMWDKPEFSKQMSVFTRPHQSGFPPWCSIMETWHPYLTEEWRMPMPCWFKRYTFREFPGGLMTEDPVLPLLCLRFNPWPGSFCMGERKKKKKALLVAWPSKTGYPNLHLYTSHFKYTRRKFLLTYLSSLSSWTQFTRYDKEAGEGPEWPNAPLEILKVKGTGSVRSLFPSQIHSPYVYFPLRDCY